MRWGEGEGPRGLPTDAGWLVPEKLGVGLSLVGKENTVQVKAPKKDMV